MDNSFADGFPRLLRRRIIERYIPMPKVTERFQPCETAQDAKLSIKDIVQQMTDGVYDGPSGKGGAYDGEALFDPDTGEFLEYQGPDVPNPSNRIGFDKCFLPDELDFRDYVPSPPPTPEVQPPLSPPLPPVDVPPEV